MNIKSHKNIAMFFVVDIPALVPKQRHVANIGLIMT